MTDTVKIVVNRCYGGFGLSEPATRALIGKCSHVELMEPREYYGARDDWEKRFADDQARGSGAFGVIVHDGKIVLDEHRADEARACPHLVAVIESMGADANGWAAELEVVDVPSGVAWTIEEYDGREWVSEVHRTW